MRFGLRLPSFALGSSTRPASRRWARTCAARRTSASRARCSSTTCSSRRRPIDDAGSSRSRCCPRWPASPARSGSARWSSSCRSAIPWRSPRSGRRSTCCPAAGRSWASASAGTRGSSRPCGIPFQERGRRMNEMLEAITALWAGDHVTYEGQFYRFEDLTSTRSRSSGRIRRSGSVAAPSRPRRSTARQCRHDPARAAADRQVRRDVGAALVGDGRDGRRGLGDHPRGHGRVRPRPGRDDQGLLELRARPQARREARVRGRRSSGVYSGMDLPYWQEFYLLGEAEAVAERIRGKIEALGGVEHADPEPARLGSRARSRSSPRDVLPLVRDVTGGRWAATSDRPVSTRRSARSPAGAADPARRGHGRLPGSGRPVCRRRRPRRVGAARLRAIVDRRRHRAGSGPRDLDRLGPGRPAARFDGLQGRGPGDRRGPDPEPRHGLRQRLQRLAGRGRPAEPHRARCPGRAPSARGSREVPIGAFVVGNRRTDARRR